MVTNYYGARFPPNNSLIRNYEHNENFLAGYKTTNSKLSIPDLFSDNGDKISLHLS
jgi:hypothetical protein